MKKQFCRVLSALLLLSTLFLSGCGGFFVEEQSALQIASIESVLMEDGQTKITITYTDEFKEPYVFYLPKGAEGAAGTDGNGIRTIEYQHDAVNRQTAVRILYTDTTMEPTVFAVPDGLSVTGIQEGTDAVTGKPYVVFVYSDGTLSDQIFLPEGKQGIGIQSLTHTPNEDKSVSIDVVLDNGKKTSFLVPAPETGNGIADIVAGENGDEYVLTVNYTNGESAELRFPRPADPNEWFTGSEDPSPYLGEDGDYFFDLQHRTIWARQNGAWKMIIDFKTEETTHTVSFDLNDAPSYDAKMNEGALSIYTVSHGSYFYADAYNIPIPTRPGYTFGGWYTKKSVDTRVMSPFTDLTAVLSDLTLYAYWIEN